MKKTTAKPTDETNTQISFTVERTNLHDFGYTRAGNVQGDPAVYGSYLERLMNGDLVDQKHKGLTEQEKAEKRKKIEELSKFLDESRKENARHEKEIESKKKQIEEYRSELLKGRTDRAEKPAEHERETFSPLKFSINLFILIFLTGYLFFFYVSAAYKALFQDTDTIALSMSQGIGSGTILPNPAELAEALQFNFMLLLVPFVFYAFGWAFHILLDMRHRAKIVFIGLLVTLTFIVDLLLAMRIHETTEFARWMIGGEKMAWYQSTTFFIILFFGFLVYVLWSILLDTLIREWNKYQSTLNLKKIIRHLRQDIKLLEQKIMPVELVQKEIDMLIDQVNTFFEGNLKAYIDQFTTGWISYLAPESMKDTKNKCLAIKEDFISSNHILPGVVKVMKPIKMIKI
ncbi:MAG: hypothetical protein JW801_04390 [Bacteroidales bacterium]|nr:hypothetical protein [Bacteroidales bacterium]